MESMPAGVGESFLRDFVSLELAVGNGFVDASEVLRNDPAPAQIEMADLGIAHLAFGKSDIGAARAQSAPGIIAIELIVKRGLGEERGVAVFLCLRFAAGIDAPAVANNEHHWASHTRALCRLMAAAASVLGAGRWEMESRSSKQRIATEVSRRYRRRDEVAESIAGAVVS